MNQPCKNNPFCSSMAPTIRELLCSHATTTYQISRQIQAINQGDKQLEIIVDGVLIAFTILEDGTQKGIELIKKGDILGTHLLFDKLEYSPYHTMALNEIKKCIFPVKYIEGLFHENSLFAQALMQNLSRHLAKNNIFWMSMHSKDGEEKVKYIYKLLQDSNVDMNKIIQEDLALIAGVSRTTVARAMKTIYKK
ncbi:Crp/Fnr family transcriptional regulator [Desulfitobacterium hafniense]|uniref:Crp/Fnr family transcriptional regulator n=2 Tax=Desulfitobacterium hafniense TaxID=49338 RepID=A0A0W1JL85_DESHA|nr:Crp/Fnr family transcriptional regulator [Desulfitobacterium hafniense]